MMANIEERLVDLINTASIEVDGKKKIEYLYQIRELALNHGLIDKFFHEILAFQNERASSVKKFILAFIEQACKHNCQLCPKAILSLNLLLNDTNTEVQKRSIQAATQFYRVLAQWILSTISTTTVAPTTTSNNNPVHVKLEPATETADLGGRGSENPPLSSEIESTWLTWLQISNHICHLLDNTNNDGIRTHCIKFIETIILMQTPRDKYTDPSYEPNLIDPMITPVELSKEASMCSLPGLPKGGVLFNGEHKLQLVETSKQKFEHLVVFHGTSHISSVNLMAAMQSLVVLAKQRYRIFMGRVIQAMESLNNKLPPTLTASQVQSVKKFLKLQLTVMLKHPYSLDHFQPQITQLLQAVGSRQPEIHKVINDFIKTKYGSDPQSNLISSDIQKRIKLDQDPKQGAVGSQNIPVGKSKHLDLNKLTQELDDKEKCQIVVDSVRRILGEDKKTYIPPVQMDIKKKVLSTIANEFHDTECPKIIQDYIFADLRNRHEISYAIIRKNYDVAAVKASKRGINLFDNQELLKNYFDCFNSYLNRAMDLKDSKEKEVILPKLYALREEYYTASNQDQDQDHDLEHDDK